MKKIGMIGCGNMGEAILNAIILNKIAHAKDMLVSDVESTRLDSIKKKYGVNVTFNNSNVAKASDTVILAVKPQEVNAALLEISESLDDSKLIISIAAGVTIKRITKTIGSKTTVIRVMPNMPALIKKGFSAISYPKGTEKKAAELAIRIFSAIGDVVEVKEKDLDAITAISGSGPAYYFYITELLIKAGIKLGLKKDTATRAALKTALGSAELLEKMGEDPSVLRKRVTSKGGTTEAAFKVFKKKKLESIVLTGIKAAKKRSKELSGGC